MNIRVFIPNNNPLHAKVLNAFAAGIDMCGHSVKNGSVDECVDADIAVIFGVGKKAVPASFSRGEILNRRTVAGKNTVVLELGYIKRETYFAAGWNGLNGNADFLNNNMPTDRWLALGCDEKPYTGGETILLCGQVPWDASVQHTDHIAWLGETIRRLRQTTNRDIVLRPHPLALKHTPSFMGARLSRDDLHKDITNSHAVVTFNSNVGVDAVIAGKATFCADVGSMVFDVANKDLSRINMPQYSHREKWCNNIAYAQWSLEEMSEGAPWKHLTRFMEIRT